MNADEARKALADHPRGRAKGRTPDEARRRVRAQTRAQTAARAALVRMHRADYQILYETACADAGLYDDEGEQ